MVSLLIMQTYKIILYQKLVCSFNGTALEASKVVDLPCAPFYGLVIENEASNTTVAIDKSMCRIIYNEPRDMFRVHFDNIVADEEHQMEEVVEDFKRHGFNIKIEGTDPKDPGSKPKKKNPFTLIQGGKD